MRQFFFIVCMVLLSSCNDELFDSSMIVLGDNDSFLTFDATKDFVNEYNTLDILGLELLEMNDISPDKDLRLDDFFSDKHMYYVAYNGSTINPVMISYSALQKDTCLIHYKYEYLTKYVESILLNPDEFIAKEIIWHYKNNRFKTIALFNMKNGELMYDNILFNILAVNVNNSTKQYLNRGENVKYIYEEITFTKDGDDFKAEMLWHYAGYFMDDPTWNTAINGPAPKVYKSLGCAIVHKRATHNNHLFGLYGISIKSYLRDNNTGYPAIGSYYVGFGVGGANFTLPTVYYPEKEEKTDSIGNGYSYRIDVTED